MFFGVIFLIIGIAILLQNLGLITGDIWGYVWAGFFIAIGLTFLFRKKGMCWCSKDWHKGKEE